MVATIDDGDCRGRGECVPYRRYGESVAAVAAAINAFNGPFDRQALLTAMPGPGRLATPSIAPCGIGNRNAPSGRFGQLAGVARPVDILTAFTLSLDSPAAMAEQAAASHGRPLLKIKLGSPRHRSRHRPLRAVRESAPHARLIVDANEGCHLPRCNASCRPPWQRAWN